MLNYYFPGLLNLCTLNSARISNNVGAVSSSPAGDPPLHLRRGPQRALHVRVARPGQPAPPRPQQPVLGKSGRATGQATRSRNKRFVELNWVQTACNKVIKRCSTDQLLLESRWFDLKNKKINERKTRLTTMVICAKYYMIS